MLAPPEVEVEEPIISAITVGVITIPNNRLMKPLKNDIDVFAPDAADKVTAVLREQGSAAKQISPSRKPKSATKGLTTKHKNMGRATELNICTTEIIRQSENASPTSAVGMDNPFRKKSANTPTLLKNISVLSNPPLLPTIGNKYAETMASISAISTHFFFKVRTVVAAGVFFAVNAIGRCGAPKNLFCF
jgi:hypothetical protein